MEEMLFGARVVGQICEGFLLVNTSLSSSRSRLPKYLADDRCLWPFKYSIVDLNLSYLIAIQTPSPLFLEMVSATRIVQYKISEVFLIHSVSSSSPPFIALA